MAQAERGLFVGIDWSTGDQVVSVHDDVGELVAERSFPYSGGGLAALCAELSEFVDGQSDRVRVAIETPHGAVVDTLLEHDFAVFVVNPKQLDRFRDRFTVAGAKDDRRDAHVLASSLRTDTQAFRRLSAEKPEIIQLREWSRMAENLKRERVALSNQLREQLRRYYPQILGITSDIWKPWFLDLWEAVPTPSRARRVRKATIGRILSANRIRAVDAGQALNTLRQTPLVVAPGVVEAATAHNQLLVERLRVGNKQVRHTEQTLDTICKEIALQQANEGCGPHDVEILLSLPGVGRIVLAVLLAEGSRALQSRDYQQLRCLSGVAPVTSRSGKSWRVSMRRACHARLREAFYHMARTSIQADERCKSYYTRLRARGHKHGRALRSLADSLLRTMCAMLRDRSLYDPQKRRPSEPHVA